MTAKIVRRVLVLEAILRQSKRLTKGVPPNRVVVNYLTADVSSIGRAIELYSGKEQSRSGNEAMVEEMRSIESKGTW